MYGLDVHISGIAPAQSGSCTLCIDFAGVATITMPYTAGAGRFTILDLMPEPATTAAATDAPVLDNCDTAYTADVDTDADACPSKECKEDTTVKASADLQKHAVVDSFLTHNLAHLSAAVLGRHGKLHSRCKKLDLMGSKDQDEDKKQCIAVVPSHSYHRHTNTDPFALQNNTMLLIAQCRELKMYVSNSICIHVCVCVCVCY
jgi:hypothetical protein